MAVAVVISAGALVSLVGTGMRYLVLTALVLNTVIVVIMMLLAAALFADLRQARLSLQAAPSDLERELAQYEHIRLRFKDSPNAQDREDVRAKLPPAIARAKTDNAELVAHYRRTILRGSIGTLIALCLAVVAAWTTVAIRRFYTSLRASLPISVNTASS